MIYCETTNDKRAVQAVQVSADAGAQCDLFWWLNSISGLREFTWQPVSHVLSFGHTKWREGDWIIAEVDKTIGDTVFSRMTNEEFGIHFARVV